ncbi:MAG: hypothetical protein RI964_3303 [Pseudomonadota bacterium]|jgi:hypothetical protein
MKQYYPVTFLKLIITGLLLLIVSHNSIAKEDDENTSASIPSGIHVFEQYTFCQNV